MSHDHFNRCRKKAFDKIQYPFLIKVLKNLGTEGIYYIEECLNIVKAKCNKPIVNIILNGEKQKPFPLKTGMR
jgi:hypothetical protein